LAKAVSGMREARSIGLLGDEPWRLAKAVSSSIEHLLAGARECNATIIGTSLISALENLKASMTAERTTEDPIARLHAAAEDLRHSGKHLSSLEKGSKRERCPQIDRGSSDTGRADGRR